MRRRGLDVNRKRCVRSRGGRCLALVCALPTRPWRCPPRSTHAVYSCGRCRCRGAYRLAKRNAPLRRQPLTRLRHGRHSSLVRPVATTRQASRDELPEILRAAAVRPTVRWSAIWKLEWAPEARRDWPSRHPPLLPLFVLPRVALEYVMRRWHCTLFILCFCKFVSDLPAWVLRLEEAARPGRMACVPIRGAQRPGS